MHEEAVSAALDTYYNDGNAHQVGEIRNMRKAIAAFLRWSVNGVIISERNVAVIDWLHITADELEENP